MNNDNLPLLILASKSKARQNMLYLAGLRFQTIPANIDESAIIEAMQKQGTKAAGIASALAQEKALEIAKNNPEILVIGSDQILEFEGGILEKAASKKEALEKLRQLSGKQHRLISAVTVVQNNKALWQYTDFATLTMRDLNEEFLNTYAEKAGETLTSCVGAYEVEGLGAQLFTKIDGDFFTILGLPLLPLLNYLREQHGVML